MMQYIGVSCRPDISVTVQLPSPVSEPSTKEEFDLLRKVMRHLKKTQNDGLNFFRLDLTTKKLVVFTDDSFANARGMKIQLGFVIQMRYVARNSDIFHYGSELFQRFTRSLMASELHAMIIGFDYAFLIC